MNTICLYRLASLVVLAACFAGCTNARRPLAIEPVNKPATAAIQPEFKESYYRVDRDGDIYFYMHTNTTEPATNIPVEQIAVVRMFWRPVGGTTTMNPTALNCTYRYILLTPTSVGMYEGAGFLRIKGKPGLTALTARIVDGDLRLTEASANFVDNLGRCRIHGNFKAEPSDAQTMDLTIQAQQKFLAQSLALSGKPAAPAKPDNLDK